MVKKQEYPRRGSQGGYNNQGQRNSQEQGAGKEGYQQQRSFQREGGFRHNNSSYHGASRYNKSKGEETVEDIQADISRIEKEIELEIKEIKSLRLGL